MRFYPRAWAKYPEAVSGSLKLLPPAYRFESLATDYDWMKGMLYGEIPSFEAVMTAVGELEKEINESTLKKAVEDAGYEVKGFE